MNGINVLNYSAKTTPMNFKGKIPQEAIKTTEKNLKETLKILSKKPHKNFIQKWLEQKFMLSLLKKNPQIFNPMWFLQASLTIPRKHNITSLTLKIKNSKTKAEAYQYLEQVKKFKNSKNCSLAEDKLLLEKQIAELEKLIEEKFKPSTMDKILEKIKSVFK